MPDIPLPDTVWPATPDLMAARRVLAVQPHYDDNDIAGGGTLAALAENGAEIFYLTVTDDLVGFIDQSVPQSEMEKQLQAEQRAAGRFIGVDDFYWLGYPDAGRFDHFDLRRDIIRYVRLVRPDFIFTCDPWMPYEAHFDHVRTGFAVAEAATLFNFTRLATEPDVDQAFEPFELQGIVFYASAFPNTVFDISTTFEKKHQAVRQYAGQFTLEELDGLVNLLDARERKAAAQPAAAADERFSHGEPLKVLSTWQLHVNPTTIHE